MGSPKAASQVFIVAGTNGKGSTVATIGALLGALGYRYGAYTSPHLIDYNERIQVNGVAVSEETLLMAFESVEKARGEVSLTYFEFGTLAAIEILTRAGLDFAVMEVGLGGRLDTVNLLDADCAVITPIGLDHQAFLGDDLESIGREKAGIIRPGRPVICGANNPPSSVISRARDLGAPIKCLGKDFFVEKRGEKARLTLGEWIFDLPVPMLGGPHQLNNMATSVMALLELIPSAGDNPAALIRGLQAVSLVGRFERISQHPAVWIDVGHNPLAAEALSAGLAQAIQSEGISRIRCVIGMLVDKDVAGVTEALESVVDAWFCAGLEGDRGQSGVALAQRLQQTDTQAEIRVFKDVAGALDSAVAESSPHEGVLVFGSFFTAAEALQHWRSHNRGI
jgi:dihydrofolate synthase/folylpolyglutamate synthase